MIVKKHRTDHQCLKLAFIEASLDSQGFYNNTEMSRVFGNHVKDAARIMKRYKTEFGGVEKQGRANVPTADYRRQVLKRSTNAWEFIAMLEILHGSTHNERRIINRPCSVR